MRLASRGARHVAHNSQNFLATTKEGTMAREASKESTKTSKRGSRQNAAERSGTRPPGDRSERGRTIEDRPQDENRERDEEMDEDEDEMP